MPYDATLVGHATEPIRHEVDARWIMSYAAGLNDFNPAYLRTDHAKVVAHPLFPVCLEWPTILSSRHLPGSDALTPAEAARSVHAAHDLHILRPISEGETLTTQATVTGMEAIGPGAAVTTRLDTCDAHGELVARTWQLGIARGVTLIISGGLPVVGLPREFESLAEGSIAGIPSVLFVLGVCAVLTHVALHSTKLGRYTYAIGSNKEAAVYAGISVSRYTVAVYAISGMLTGLAGMIEASRLMTGQPTAGQGYELQVIAAVVIGGGSLTGGEGSVIGTLIGAFIMGLLSNGSDLLGVNPYLQQALIGAIIILAVAVDEARKRRFRQ